MELHQYWVEMDDIFLQVRIFGRFSSLFFYSFLLQLRNTPTNFRKAAHTGCRVTSILGRNRWYISTGTSFHSILLIPFSFSFSIATKRVYKFSKGYAHWLWSYINIGSNGWYISTGTNFRGFFFIILLFSFFTATKQAYEFSKGCAKRIWSYIKFG